jgi:hypothetical protein
MTDTSKRLGMIPDDLFYWRQASTLANPVPALTSNFVLISYDLPTDRELLVYAIGSDQHDSSVYEWVVDGVTLPVSGTAKPGGIYDPLIFPEPIRATYNVTLLVTNNGASAYPNSSGAPGDQIPYEGVIIGRWVR